jgi:hypothetical protein
MVVDNEAYASIAAAWHHAKKAGQTVSLTKFVNSPGVLLLGASKTYRTALATINRLLIRRLSDLAFDHKDACEERRTWFVLDEFPSLGHIPFIEELATQGRSKGAPLAVGVQDPDHVNQLYPKTAATFFRMFWTSAFFKVQDQDAAEWVTKRFPPREDRPDPERPWVIRELPAVTKRQVMRLRRASKWWGFQCIIKAEEDVIPGPRRITVGPRDGPPKCNRADPTDPKRSSSIKRDDQDLIVKPWDELERKKFGLSEVPEPAPTLPLPTLSIPGDGWISKDELPH